MLGEDGRGKGNGLGGKRDRGGRKNISSYPMNFVIVVVVLEMNSDFSSLNRKSIHRLIKTKSLHGFKVALCCSIGELFFSC